MPEPKDIRSIVSVDSLLLAARYEDRAEGAAPEIYLVKQVFSLWSRHCSSSGASCSLPAVGSEGKE